MTNLKTFLSYGSLGCRRQAGQKESKMNKKRLKENGCQCGFAAWPLINMYKPTLRGFTAIQEGKRLFFRATVQPSMTMDDNIRNLQMIKSKNVECVQAVFHTQFCVSYFNLGKLLQVISNLRNLGMGITEKFKFKVLNLLEMY